VAAIGADVVLVAELGDRQIDHRRLALAGPGLGRLDGPVVDLLKSSLPVSKARVRGWTEAARERTEARD
jgi:hypothetical protein